jgi:hypothetical protein
MEANRKERCEFDVNYNNEIWHIEMAWIQANGNVAWYDGGIYRDGVKFMRIFSPGEIVVPKITR